MGGGMWGGWGKDVGCREDGEKVWNLGRMVRKCGMRGLWWEGVGCGEGSWDWGGEAGGKI